MKAFSNFKEEIYLSGFWDVSVIYEHYDLNKG